MSHDRQKTIDRISNDQEGVRRANCDELGYEVGKVISPGIVVYQHHPAGISKEDFYLFCRPDDASSRGTLTNVRSQLSSFAAANNGFADVYVDGVRPYITREAIDEHIKELVEKTPSGARSQHATILRFILDHTEPAVQAS